VSTLNLITCAVLIAISALLSSSEIALFSLSKFQVKLLRERFKNVHRKLKILTSDPVGMLITLLVSNEIVNVSLSTIISRSIAHDINTGWIHNFKLILSQFTPLWASDVLLGTLITSPILLIFCEISPKVLGARANTLIGPLGAGPLFQLYRIFSPLRKILGGFFNWFGRIVKGQSLSEQAQSILSERRLKEEDFLSIVEEAQKEGAVQEHEVELIRNVLELDDTPILEITTPITRVFGLQAQTTLTQALDAIKDDSRNQKFSRIPIFGKSRSEVMGILYSKDLLVSKLEKEDLQAPVSSIAWRPFSVHQNTRVSTVFRRMKKQRTHMAIVLNELNQAIGLVTMHDVLDALLEELLEDPDQKEDFE